MAAYLNRTMSMVTGNGTGFDGNSLGDTSRTLQMAHDVSPLQIFVRAKKKINDIFGEIEGYVVETNAFVQNTLMPEMEIVDKAEAEEFLSYRLKVAGIREVLKRNHMKVAFFGRTSNGKSSVINAMLGDKILPSGIGHTTNCFCSVEGCDGEAFLIREGSEEKLNVKDVKHLANALCEEKLSESSLVRVFWPRQKCSLLRDDVILIDSPGFDITKNLDDWISNHCLNADVFVFVLNAESTMSKAEKQFFHEVSKCLSKPNVFVLNNRWDASASEPEMQDSVRQQHQERCVDFLTKELKVCTTDEAKERVFFISAREALQGRMLEAVGQPAHNGAIALEGFQARYFEFQDFERKFEECISKSAVKTKFEQHTAGGKDIAKNMFDMLNNIYDRTSDIRNKQLAHKETLNKRITQTESELMAVTREMKAKINRMVEEVEQKVSKALNEEIWRLNVLVDEFNLSFHTDPLVLNVYKKEINAYVETGVGSKLRNRLSTALAMNIESAQKEMQDRMHALVPTDNTKLLQTNKLLTRKQPFEMLYSLNCQNLCADFKEDLEFRFSWGITAMIHRFTGKSNSIRNKNSEDDRAKSAISNVSIPPMLSPSTPTGNPNTCLSVIPSTGMTQEQISVLSRVALASIGSQGTVGGLVVAGLLLKTIGWRVLVGVGVLYGSVYLYERLSWTTSAKERTFKSQYVQHATRKLKMIVDLTSANCSHQVQQELSNTFACLCRVVDESSTDMNERLKQTETALTILESHQKQLKVLRNKATYFANELDIFENNYIKSN